MIKKVVKTVFIGFFSLIVLWFVCAWLLSKINNNVESSESKETITIYVKSNGMHTDIVMPVNNDYFNWNSFIDKRQFLAVNEDYHYVAIGWGDKGFYLNTPTLADLKMKTLVKALFGVGSSAMHVTYYKHIKCCDKVKQINISKEAYLNLVSHITQSFKLDNEQPQLISHPNYGQHDNYFEANGTYSVFKTCNVWTGNTLKTANITMGIWTPLEFGVMDNL